MRESIWDLEDRCLRPPHDVAAALRSNDKIWYERHLIGGRFDTAAPMGLTGTVGVLAYTRRAPRKVEAQGQPEQRDMAPRSSDQVDRLPWPG